MRACGNRLVLDMSPEPKRNRIGQRAYLVAMQRCACRPTEVVALFNAFRKSGAPVSFRVALLSWPRAGDAAPCGTSYRQPVTLADAGNRKGRGKWWRRADSWFDSHGRRSRWRKHEGCCRSQWQCNFWLAGLWPGREGQSKVKHARIR
jgi:hypothetical protein